jgi:hypothetical protein
MCMAMAMAICCCKEQLMWGPGGEKTKVCFSEPGFPKKSTHPPLPTSVGVFFGFF